MILQCTPEVFAKLSKLRTRFPWAVVDMDGVAVEVFNCRASAQGFAQVEQARTGSYYNASDATGAYQMPANILNLPTFTVQRVEEADHNYHVYAEVSNPPSTCATCNSDRLIGHGRNEQVIRDLPTHGKREKTDQNIFRDHINELEQQFSC